ncbi:MAG TPA: hypothetical protein VN921_01450 [Chthoniobacterales bacterium]|nr:hypothetical protein [Chthoniobacterales bacterium]
MGLSVTPKTFATKTLTSVNLPGVNIAVDTVQVDSNPIVYEITATIPGTPPHIYTERHAIGANGTGPIELTTAAALQAQLDGYRQKVADAAAWQVAMSGPQAAIV